MMACTTGSSADCAAAVGGIARQTTMSRIANGKYNFLIAETLFSQNKGFTGAYYSTSWPDSPKSPLELRLLIAPFPLIHRSIRPGQQLINGTGGFGIVVRYPHT
jgi:hypothetical protein